MKIAIPVFGSRISPRMDCAKRVLLIKVEETGRKVLFFEEKEFQTVEAGENIEFYLSNEIEVVICGAISIEMQAFLVKHEIRVISWVTGEAQKALDLFIEGTLASGTMLCPGMKLRKWRFCCQEKTE